MGRLLASNSSLGFQIARLLSLRLPTLHVSVSHVSDTCLMSFLAVANLSSEVVNNVTALADVISYHFIEGFFQNVSFVNTSTSASGSSSSASASSTSPPSSSASIATATVTVSSQALWNTNSSIPQLFAGVFPNVTLGRTLLNDTDIVHLEGNKSQVLAWTRSGDNGNVTILNQL